MDKSVSPEALESDLDTSWAKVLPPKALERDWDGSWGTRCFSRSLRTWDGPWVHIVRYAKDKCFAQWLLERGVRERCRDISVLCESSEEVV